MSNMAGGEQPKWLVVGAKLERELDDVCDIWAPARVTGISTSGVLVEYEDGLIEADIPFEHLRQVRPAFSTDRSGQSTSLSGGIPASSDRSSVAQVAEAFPSSERDCKLAELREVIELWSTTADTDWAHDEVVELHKFGSVSQDYREAMQAGSQPNVICTNGIIMHEASLSSNHCKLALQYGNILWIAGSALAKFLSWCATDIVEPSLHRAWDSLRVLELGAGTGVVGLTLARLGAAVTLTDNEAEVIALLERNLLANELGKTVNTHLLDFGDATTYLLQEFDVIVAADVLYNTCQAEKLAHTLNAHVRPGTEVFLSYEKRQVCHQLFFTEIVSMGLQVERLEDSTGRAVWDATYMAAKAYSESRFVSLGDDWKIPASPGRIQIFRLFKPLAAAGH